MVMLGRSPLVCAVSLLKLSQLHVMFESVGEYLSLSSSPGNTWTANYAVSFTIMNHIIQQNSAHTTTRSEAIPVLDATPRLTVHLPVS